jgi:uncharacterized protein (DUF983 family)
VNDCCDVGGDELFHHRADDFPAYVVIFIVAHPDDHASLSELAF